MNDVLLESAYFDEDDYQRFWERVQLGDSADDCYLWIGRKSGAGYGMFRTNHLNPKQQQAHRVSWMMVNGRFPDPELVVKHACHVKNCVNPRHLSEGTFASNIREAFPLLSDDDVVMIRRLGKLGWKFVDIAKRYDCSPSTIESIVNNRRRVGP